MVGEGEGHQGEDVAALRREQGVPQEDEGEAGEEGLLLLLLFLLLLLLLLLLLRLLFLIIFLLQVNDLLEDNKELIENIKKSAAETKVVLEERGKEFDAMMEKTVCEAI